MRLNKFVALFLLLLTCAALSAQKTYLVHITIDKIVLGKDSVVFKGGKTFLLETPNRTDTFELGKPGGIPVAIVVEIRRAKVGEQIKYQVGYSFFKKPGSKWELIRNFGFINRNDLFTPKAGFETTGKKKHANEEYHCSLGEPQVFEAFFRMDVYKK